MDSFAFMIHPIDVSDVARKFGFAKHMPESLVERFLRMVPPLNVSKITGVETKYNAVEGMFVCCPLTTRQMVNLPEDYVVKRIIQTGKLAQKLGAKVLGL